MRKDGAAGWRIVRPELEVCSPLTFAQVRLHRDGREAFEIEFLLSCDEARLWRREAIVKGNVFWQGGERSVVLFQQRQIRCTTAASLPDASVFSQYETQAATQRPRQS